MMTIFDNELFIFFPLYLVNYNSSIFEQVSYLDINILYGLSISHSPIRGDNPVNVCHLVLLKDRKGNGSCRFYCVRAVQL